jgi:hypothetical protein
MSADEPITNGTWDSCKMYVLRELQRMNALHEKALEERERVNDKLDAIKDMLQNLIPNGKNRVETLEQVVDGLKTIRDINKGKASQSSVVWSYIVGGIGILGSLWALVRSFVSMVK